MKGTRDQLEDGYSYRKGNISTWSKPRKIGMSNNICSTIMIIIDC